MPRQNEYFVPRDGIDREVISADICRYLGNDALVRPGFYENPQTGQVVEGYYITAYRNLTTAMIEDLKADSARWESERRAQSSRAAASLSIHALADASRIVARHSSNSPLAQYRMSEIHMARQHHGPSEVYGDNTGAREPPSVAPRYPGTGAPGYTGASGTYPNQQGYAPPGGNGYTYPPNQSPQPTASRNPSHSSGSVMSPPGYPTGQDHPYVATGANNNNRYEAYARGNVQPGPQMSDYGSQAQAQPGYPASYSQYPNQVSPGVHGGMQPPDGYYDRVMPTVQAPMAQSQPPMARQTPAQQQYDETPVTRASATPASKAQTPPASSSNRRNDRDVDRHHRTSRR